jgi:hypothetical protein
VFNGGGSIVVDSDNGSIESGGDVCNVGSTWVGSDGGATGGAARVLGSRLIVVGDGRNVWHSGGGSMGSLLDGAVGVIGSRLTGFGNGRDGGLNGDWKGWVADGGEFNGGGSGLGTKGDVSRVIVGRLTRDGDERDGS